MTRNAKISQGRHRGDGEGKYEHPNGDGERAVGARAIAGPTTTEGADGTAEVPGKQLQAKGGAVGVHGVVEGPRATWRSCCSTAYLSRRATSIKAK